MRASLLLLLPGVLLVSPAAFAAPKAPSIEEVAKRVGFPPEARSRAKQGEVVAHALPATSDKDLALAVGARINASPEQVYDFVDHDKLAKFQTVIVSEGDIQTTDFAVKGMKLPEATLKRLASNPGATFYMSEAEAARIKAAGKNGTTAALTAYEQVLSARARAYWEKGLAGIEPYGPKGRSPAEDLGHANTSAKKFLVSKELHALIDAVPSRASGEAEHQLQWSVQKGRDQQAPVLIHRMLYRVDGGKIFIDRRFYSGYDYDSLQIVVGVLPTADGNSAVIYTNHTYTSQVAGFGGSAKRSIGTKLLEKDLVAEMQRAQKVIPGG